MDKLLRITIARGSKAKIKRIGDEGQPCLVPQRIVKGVDEKTTYLIEAMGLVYRAFIQVRKLSPKPHLRSTKNKYVQDKESNALRMSSDRNIGSNFCKMNQAL